TAEHRSAAGGVSSLPSWGCRRSDPSVPIPPKGNAWPQDQPRAATIAERFQADYLLRRAPVKAHPLASRNGLGRPDRTKPPMIRLGLMTRELAKPFSLVVPA